MNPTRATELIYEGWKLSKKNNPLKKCGEKKVIYEYF